MCIRDSWYAAFHDEGKHPHVHMMAWSTQPGEAYLTRDGIRNIKSTLTNQIFKQEMLHTYEQKSQSRDELVREARRAIRQLTQEMAQSICTAPEICLLYTSLLCPNRWTIQNAFVQRDFPVCD